MFLLAILLSIATNKIQVATANTNPVEGRYSFSLTTFHPSGQLPQLSHATKASSLGPPILAFRDTRGIVLTSLQSLPSPLIHDDGTARFVKLTDSILIGHTGVNADGRVVTEAAQRLAVEHAYTFQEEIPMDILLEEMALLYQEYTMKAGVRPFGCCLIVAGLNDDDGGLYRIDPSGAVTQLDDIAFAGRGDGDATVEKVKQRIQADVDGNGNLESIEDVLIEALREEVIGGKQSSCQSIICARLSSDRDRGFIQRLRRVAVDVDSKEIDIQAKGDGGAK